MCLESRRRATRQATRRGWAGFGVTNPLRVSVPQRDRIKNRLARRREDAEDFK